MELWDYTHGNDSCNLVISIDVLDMYKKGKKL